MNSVSTVVLSRDCDAVQIPAGNIVTIPAGTEVDITQTLGGSYTIHDMGGLFRVGPKDADALGITPAAETPAVPATGEIDEKAVWDMLRSCYDPEIPVDVFELGLIYDVFVSENNDVKILMTLTSPNCPVAETLPIEIEEKVKTIEEVNNAEVEITFDPIWTQDMMSEEAKLELGFL